tara:strand:+ start:797 stop:1042 length:246 start_codon:yes stop_codon:yes gene_type:complete
MIPKVGQLLRWHEVVLRDVVGHENDDIGIVKEVQFDGEQFFGNDEYEYVVIVDWCKGPHHSYHDQQEWEESIQTNEIVPVE